MTEEKRMPEEELVPEEGLLLEEDLAPEEEAALEEEPAAAEEAEEATEAEAEAEADLAPEEPSEDEIPHPDIALFLDDEGSNDWSYVPLLDIMQEPNIVKEEYVTHRSNRSKPKRTPLERAKALWIPAALIVLVMLAVGAWNAWHTPLRKTQSDLVDKYGMLTSCEVREEWYEPALESTDGAGNHPLEYGIVSVNGKEAYCIVNDSGDVLYDNFRSADFVVYSIPRSIYMLAAAVDPYYAACAISGVPRSTEEYLAMAQQAIAEYDDPISLWPSATGNGIVIFLSSAIPQDQYETYVEQCKGLAVPTVRIMRVPADEWRDFQDWIAEWPDYYTTYGLVGLNVLNDNPLIYEGDENAFTHLEDIPSLVEEDIEIVPRAAAEE